MNLFFAKMYEMLKLIQSLECQYVFLDLGILQKYLYTKMERLGNVDGWTISQLGRSLDALVRITSHIGKPLVSVYCELPADTWGLNWNRRNAGTSC